MNQRIVSNSRDEMVGRKWRAFQDLTMAITRTQREDGTGCSGLSFLLGKGDPVSQFSGPLSLLPYIVFKKKEGGRTLEI